MNESHKLFSFIVEGVGLVIKSKIFKCKKLSQAQEKMDYVFTSMSSDYIGVDFGLVLLLSWVMIVNNHGHSLGHDYVLVLVFKNNFKFGYGYSHGHCYDHI